MSRGKKWTAVEKAQIVLEGLGGETSIVELSRRHGFDQSQFYRWRGAFLAGGTAALETRPKDPTRADLQRQLSECERLVGKSLSIQSPSRGQGIHQGLGGEIQLRSSPFGVSLRNTHGVSA